MIKFTRKDGMFLVGDNMCFGCSKENPMGLQLDFHMEQDDMVTEFIPEEVHQSYDGVLHGGLAAVILDEVVGQHLVQLGSPGVTARMNVRFRNSIPVGKKVRFVSRFIKQRHRLYDMEAWAELEDGKRAVEASVQMMVTD